MRGTEESTTDPINSLQEIIAPGLMRSDRPLERPRASTNCEGERQMLQEILTDAIQCWQSVSATNVMSEDYVTGLRERLYREANFWIFGEYKNAPFFSFTQVCDCLGFNPDFIRRLLLEWRHKQRAIR